MSHRAHPGQVGLNRIDRPGTAEDSWDGWIGLKRVPAVDPSAWPSAVIVAALSRDIAERKRAGISAFTSQLTDRENAGPVLPPGIVAHFTRDQEELFR